ncbi:MAG: superoxide dismutase [Elusimicrobia bacterium]|nr:MAG: superoxide dismutase [Elusimicrobiota bacterium]
MQRALIAGLFSLACMFPVNALARARGEAVLHGNGINSGITGMMYLVEHNGGLQITVSLAKAPSGLHGFHIHEFGSCGNKGKAAGSHFNPMGAAHGFLPQGGPHHAHVGDLGNIRVGANGQAVLKLFIAGMSLTKGLLNVAGRGVILHAKADDFSQPLGNAGARIACGAIVLTGNKI